MAASRVPLPLYTFCLLGLLSPSTNVAAEPQFVDKLCPVDPPSTNDHSADHHLTTTLHSDLSSALFSSLSTNPTALTNGFYSFTARRPTSDASYGLFLCRGDLSPADCFDCIVFATKDVTTRCPGSKQVIIWYDECMLRYSNVSIFGTLDVSYHSGSTNDAILIEDLDFPSVLRGVLDNIVAQASRGDSSKKFATEENLSMINRKLYSLAQCTPDLSTSNCSDCLSQCTDNLFSKYSGYSYAMYRFPSCNAGFATFPFYSTSTATPHSPPPVLPPRPHPGLPPPVLPPRSPAPVLPLPHPPTSNPGKKGISFKVHNLIAIVVVPIGVSIIVLSVACFCFISRRREKKKLKNNIREDSVWTEITSVKPLRYDLGAIQAATNNLSDENKIGGDGFGPLYKGLLGDGQTIAVKKLSRTSGQDIEEFKNEVVSVATLQHRNLLKLLGFCLEGEEKMLIYELPPNKSLDCVLFDPQQQQQPLDWSRRYKIIREIAGGMLYLHEDSQLRIIHGDLKANNILLDGDMNVYISDFGIARILGVDKNQGNASEIDGTLDHMSSEYAMHGQWSVKSDVFSFGILVLEIITGKKNNVLYQSDTPMDLLSYARKLWSDEAPLDLTDATEIGPYSKNEVTRCIHVALLCVQDDPDARPSMAIVVPMLDGYSTTLSIPQPPAFLTQSRTDIALNRSRSKSIVWSVNEASISELEPR